MSARESSGYSGESEEEEELVRRVGGRGQNLVQAVLRLRRGRAGRAPPALDQTPNFVMLQLVVPCGHQVER